MKNVSTRRFLVSALLGVLALPLAPLGAQVEVRGVRATDVTPTGFSVVWQASEAATPAISIFTDETGTVDITAAFEVTMIPFHTGAPSLAGDEIAAAEFIAEEQTSAGTLGVLKVRVEGGTPETTYYYRVDTITANETLGFPKGAFAAVTTMRENAFLSESRHLLIDLASDDGLDTSGWLVLARDAAGQTPHAVSAYVGDGAGEDQVYLNLGRLFGADGTNWQPVGERDLHLEILCGWTFGVTEETVRLEFTGQFAVSTTDSDSILVSEPTDSDGDGLADGWEEANFGDLSRDGTGDFDLDEISDLDEFLEGSNPTVAALPVAPKIIVPFPGERVGSTRPFTEAFLRSGALGNDFTEFEVHAGEELGEVVTSAWVPTRGRDGASWVPSLDLSDDAPYILRVRTSNGHGYSEWVEVAFFVSLIDDAPGPLAPSAPRHGEAVDTATPRLEVTHAKDPEGESVTYRFEVFADLVGDDLVTASPSLDAELGGATAWTVDVPLSVGAMYYWRATARDPGGNETESPLSALVVDPASGAPTSPGIDAPAARSSVVADSVELSVLNGVDPDGDDVVYQFEIDTVPTFDGPDLEVSGDIPAGSAGPGITRWNVTGLRDETRYHWRARAFDGAVGSAWTVTWFFVNLADDPPSVPVVRNPGGGALVPYLEPRLEVAATTDPDGESLAHDFELYTDSALTKLVADCASESRVWDCPPALDDRTTYHWRARARDPAGQTSAWTEAQRLTTNTEIPIPPVAIIAGGSRTAVLGDELTLDGSASFDLLGRVLAFAWTFVEVPPGSILDDNSFDDLSSATPVFTPDEDGTYLVELRVTNLSLPDVDRVVIVATSLSVPPTADAGPDRLAVTGEELTLDGSGSRDPDDGPEPLSYRWSLVSLPLGSALTSASILDVDTVAARLTPDVDGIYIVRLRVDDGEHSAEDRVTVIAASDGGLPPVAAAGEDFEVVLGEVAKLDGTGTVDPDDGPEPLAFQWRFTSVPAGSALAGSDITAADTPEASFVPDAIGDYVVELEVNDGEYSVFDSVVVTAAGPPTPRFRRGDSNTDRAVDISDALFTLNWLFLGGSDPACRDSVDGNDDGQTDITDVIYTLNYLFLGGPEPKDPGPDACGVDPTQDDLPDPCGDPMNVCQ